MPGSVHTLSYVTANQSWEVGVISISYMLRKGSLRERLGKLPKAHISISGRI